MARLVGAAWTVSAFITIAGTFLYSVFTIQVLAAWRSIKWDTESEWEFSGDKWQVNGLRVICSLLLLYFASGAAICAIGFHGVIKGKPSLVRFYRDYSIADFSFCAFFTAMATYGAFLNPARAGVCEELSHHPEFLRDLLEFGLDLENCELWLERAVFVGLAITFVVLILRLHFVLAVSNYYSHLTRHSNHHHQRTASCSSAMASCLASSSSSSSVSSSSSANSLFLNPNPVLQRIFVLPNKANLSNVDLESGDVELVYAPVPKHTLPKELQDQTTEAWISGSSKALPHPHRRHHHYHSHSRRHRSSSRETTGRIKLDVSPNEGLLPLYTDVKE